VVGVILIIIAIWRLIFDHVRLREMAAQTAQVFLLFDINDWIILSEIRQPTFHWHILRFSDCFRRIPAVQVEIFLLNFVFFFLMHLIDNFDLGALFHNLIVNNLLHFLQPTKLVLHLGHLGYSQRSAFLFL
jgi:hypothetical protein